MAIAPFFWFPSTNVIDRSDYALPLNPEYIFSTSIHAWDASNLGSDSSRFISMIPAYGVWTLLHHLGFSAGFTEQVLLAALLFLGITSALYLSAELELQSRCAMLTLAGAYCFNIYTAVSLAIGHVFLLLAYMVAPLALILTARLLKARAPLPIACALALLSLIWSPLQTNPPGILSILVLPIFVLTAVLVLKKDVSASVAFKRIGLLAVSTGFVNAWWMLPLAKYIVLPGSAQPAIPANQHFWWPNFTQPVAFWEFLRGAGYWGLYGIYRGEPYFPANVYFEAPIVVATSFSLLAATFFSATRSVKTRTASWLITGLALYVLCDFMAKANNDPFAWLSGAIYYHLPGMWIFRSAYEKFMPSAMVGFAIIFGIALKHAARWQTAVIAVTVAIVGFPAFTAMLVPSPGEGQLASSHVPEGYTHIYNATEKREGKVLVLPFNGYARYTWGDVGGDVTFNFIAHEHRLQYDQLGSGNLAAIQLMQYFASDAPSRVSSLIGLSGIDTILLRKDIDRDYIHAEPASDDRALIGRVSVKPELDNEIATLYDAEPKAQYFSTDAVLHVPSADPKPLFAVADRYKGSQVAISSSDDANVYGTQPQTNPWNGECTASVAGNTLRVALPSGGFRRGATAEFSLNEAEEVVLLNGIYVGNIPTQVGCRSGNNTLIIGDAPRLLSPRVGRFLCKRHPCIADVFVQANETGRLEVNDGGHYTIEIPVHREPRHFPILLTSANAMFETRGLPNAQITGYHRSLIQISLPQTAHSIQEAETRTLGSSEMANLTTHNFFGAPSDPTPHVLVRRSGRQMFEADVTGTGGASFVLPHVIGLAPFQVALHYSIKGRASSTLLITEPKTGAVLSRFELQQGEHDLTAEVRRDIGVLPNANLLFLWSSDHHVHIRLSNVVIRPITIIERSLPVFGKVARPGHIATVLDTPTVKIVHKDPRQRYFILLTSYDTGWLAFDTGQRRFLKHHFFVNGFANAWNTGEGVDSLVVFYWPELLVFAGCIISLASVCLSVLILTRAWRKRHA